MANNSKLVPLSDIEEINVSDVADLTATATELNYSDGVTSNIQTQLDAKLDATDIATGTITPRADDIDLSGGADGDVLTVQADGSLALEVVPGAGGGDAWGDVVDADIVPDADGTRDLGTATFRFAESHVDKMYSSAWQSIFGGPSELNILSTNGSILAAFLSDVAGSSDSPVNYPRFSGSTTGNPILLNAIGTDTNIDINLIPKGSGVAQVSGVPIVSTTGTQTLTNKTLTSPTLTGTTTTDRLDYDQGVGTVSALGNLGATETIDWSTATHFSGNLDANITFTNSNSVTGQSITLYLTYSGAQRTVTWPTTTWLDNSDGSAPTTPATSGDVLVVTLQNIGGTIYGSATGNYAVYA